MHIIFGKDQLDSLKSKYVVLELDSFRIGESPVLPAYCVLENIPITDLPRVDSMTKLHQDLIDGYTRRDWKYCRDALEHLIGFWGGEVDTFYNDLSRRIEQYIENDPGEDWTPVLIK